MKYWYLKDNEKIGPLSLEKLSASVVHKNTLVWFQGLEDWTPMSEIEELKSVLEIKPPPIPEVKSTETNFNSKIYLDKNGVTIKASKEAIIGEEYELDGEKYKVVDEERLREILKNEEDVPKVVTSRVTSMGYMFQECEYSPDISSWDVSNVSEMPCMFYEAKFFDADISSWDVSKVTDMECMFFEAESFNQDISKWDVSNVTTMEQMFDTAQDFNHDIGSWDVSNVTIPRTYDGLFQDFDRNVVRSIIYDLWSNDEKIVILSASFFDTNLSSNSFSAFFISGADMIQTFGNFSNELLNHELNHKWVNSLNTYGFTGNNGHWGLIERPKSAFGVGCYPGVFSSISYQNGNISYSLQFPNDEEKFHFNDIEMALMGFKSVDDISFPIKFCKNPSNCTGNGFVGGDIVSMDKETFSSNLSNQIPDEIGDLLGLKVVVLTDRPMTDLEILFLSKKVEGYGDFYHSATQNLGSLNTRLNNSIEEVIDEDGDGFSGELDCDDLNAAINPDAAEIPNNDVDENCDGLIEVIDNDEDGFNSSIDCDDSDITINPDATEIPNNDADENCDGVVLIIDNDNDSYNSSIDCDDANPFIHPNATEIVGNEIDENCDGIIILNPSQTDMDGDGFDASSDCNDLDPLINPNAKEVYNNGVDENCDGCKCKFLIKK